MKSWLLLAIIARFSASVFAADNYPPVPSLGNVGFNAPQSSQYAHYAGFGSHQAPPAQNLGPPPPGYPQVGSHSQQPAQYAQQAAYVAPNVVPNVPQGANTFHGYVPPGYQAFRLGDPHALIQAINCRDYNLLKDLIRHNFPLNKKHDLNPLSRALFNNDAQAVQILLDNRANPSKVDRHHRYLFRQVINKSYIFVWLRYKWPFKSKNYLPRVKNALYKGFSFYRVAKKCFKVLKKLSHKH